MHGAAKQVQFVHVKVFKSKNVHQILSQIVNISNFYLTQVPVSINVLDDCVSALFNGNAEEIEADIFAAAEAEVIYEGMWNSYFLLNVK